MISSFRNFAKTKLAGVLIFIIIIPFVFWGMGSMFSSGNTNSLAKIDNKSISTQDFVDHMNISGIPEKTIRENLDKNIIPITARIICIKIFIFEEIPEEFLNFIFKISSINPRPPKLKDTNISVQTYIFVKSAHNNVLKIIPIIIIKPPIVGVPDFFIM